MDPENDNNDNQPPQDPPVEALPEQQQMDAPEEGQQIDNGMGEEDMGGEMQQQPYNDEDQYGIDPNQQVNDNFLGTNMNQQYGEEMDDGEPVNANGMFGNRGEEDEQADEEEYFDDAGDIGYLPADHVSYLNS